MSNPPAEDDRSRLRAELSNLRALLALPMLMTEAPDEDGVLELLGEAVPTLTSCHLDGVYLGEGRWRHSTEPFTGRTLRAHLQDQLQQMGRMGGTLDLPNEGWAWAYPMRSITGHAGYVLVGADAEPTSHEQFELRVLAQHAGLALINARLHARDRATAEKLKDLNTRLEETVDALERRMEIHERLSEGAAAGVGVGGITKIVHELTGFPIVVEDRHGERQAAAGTTESARGLPEGSSRERLLRRARESRRPLHADGRWFALARSRRDILGVVVMIEEAGEADEQALVALEYGATVLAMELAHLQALAEAELRRRRDIVEDLLAGADERSILMRARALDYDLEQPHRVAMIAADSPVDNERLFRAVRRAAFKTGTGSLLVARPDAVVLLTHTEVPWGQLNAAVRDALEDVRCRLGVGSTCDRPGDFPRSHREARFALRVQEVPGVTDRSLCFDDLGVFRIFGQIADPVDLGDLVTTWLSDLLAYDEEHDYDLVETLSAYLECGGNHEQTSEALLIHRSTLKYRLQRIREISGHDLGDADTRFHLQLATRAWETLQAFEG